MHEILPDDPAATPALAERIETLAAWLGELDIRVRAAELASGDEKTAKELRKAVEAIAKHDPKLQEKVQNHVDVLTDRVATLAGTVATASATLAGKEGEIAGLRRDVAGINARIEALASTARTAPPSGELDEIRRAVGRLAEEREASVPDKRLAKLEDKVGLLTQRLDTVSATVSTATAGLAGREGEVAALQRRLDEDNARLDTAVAELRQTVDPALVLELRSGVESLAHQMSAAQEETRSKLIAIGVDVDEIVSRMSETDASVATLRQQLEEDGEALALVGARLDRDGKDVARIAERVEAVDAALDELRSEQSRERADVASLAARFESGTGKVRALVQDLQEALDTRPTGPDPELADRVETVAHGLAALTAQVASLATTDEAVRTAAVDSAQTRALVHGLQARVASQERELVGLAGRLEPVSASVDALARDLRGALDTVSKGPDPSLLRTLEGQAQALAALTAEVDRITADGAVRQGAAEDWTRLRALVDELGARLASSELEARKSRDLEASLDELADRVGAIERRNAEQADSLEPLVGAGRLQVELQALALRMEHTEVAARESRDTVLAQLELLASRIEARLHRLEAEPEDLPPPRAVRDGQVIAFRSGEA